MENGEAICCFGEAIAFYETLKKNVLNLISIYLINYTPFQKKSTHNFKHLLISLYDTAIYALSHNVINFALNVNYNENH